MSTVQQSGPQISPAAFRSALRIERGGEIVCMADVLDPWQVEDFTALDSAWIRVCRGVHDGPQGAWLERPRGHSKTSDVAAMVSYALIASPSPIRGIAAAASKDQARILRDSILKLKRLNPQLLGILQINAYGVLNVHTGSEIQIISADANTSFGAQPDFIIADEVCHWPDQAGEDLWGSLFSASAKNDRCLLVAITNAGELGSWQHGVREALRRESTWYFHSLDGVQASWLDEARVEQQRRLLPPILVTRYWDNRWTGASEGAFTEDQIQAALEAGSQAPAFDFSSLASVRGWAFFGACDLGIRQDYSAVCVVAKHIGWRDFVEREKPLTSLQRALIDLGEAEAPEPDYVESGELGTGRIRLVALNLWRPTQGLNVDVADVERAIVAAHQRYQLSTLWADPSQAEYLAQRLRKQGVPVEARDQTLPALHQQCLATLDSFRESEIELAPCDELETLLEDLERAQIEAKATRVRLRSPRVAGQGHGDALTAFSLATTAARFASSGRMPTIDREDLIQAI